MPLLDIINTQLKPLETLIKKYKKILGYTIVGIAFCAIPFMFMSGYVKDTGELSLNLLWFLLFLPILARVCDIGIAKALMPLRKEVGILMGTMALVHSMGYLLPYPAYIFEKGFWWSGGYPSAYVFGLFALILTLPLLLTSNTYAIRKLGKAWKILHKAVYIIILLVVIHVVLLRIYSEFEIGPLLLLIVYFFGKTLEWKGITLGGDKQSYPKGQKWLCIPCGYIYDPLIGDEDSGVKPGTEFSDLPTDWQCPKCGVKKSDFVPYDEKIEAKSIHATIVEKKFLNPSTLELIIELEEDIKSMPGQFVSFHFEDDPGSFIRQYSIVEHIGKRLTFAIKLTENGRGATLLRDIPHHTKIKIGGVFGTFLLQNTKNPKIFIATGTGLAPIYHMIQSLVSSSQGQEHKISLYFSVATEAELFYVDQLKKIENLDLHIHVTREEVEGCEKGRVDIDAIIADKDTEWYFCGNPKMVAEGKEKLAKKGFKKIYTEEFN